MRTNTHRNLIRVLVDSFADADLPNAQMGNAREIVSRLDPQRFHVSMFAAGLPDARIASRENTRLIQLPTRRQTPRILREFLWGAHKILFYVKAAPASRWYLSLRRKSTDGRITIGTIESQSDVKNEPTITSEAVRLWEQTVLRCDYLFSNSRSVQKGLEREYGIASEIIPTGVDTGFFSPKFNRAANSRPRVLFVGSLRRYKQPQILTEAAARFPRTDFRIVGDGPLALELKSHVRTRELRNVFLVGPLAAKQLRDEYQNADIFLFPSRWEGSPKVILEAAACGLPVIGRNDYSPETVLDEITGFTVDSDEQIFSRLEALLCNAELRQELGRNGRHHSEKYDWDVITAQWEHTFSRLAMQDARKAS
jgi:glycosyltransferase involved in cell wall biosynthesis